MTHCHRLLDGFLRFLGKVWHLLESACHFSSRCMPMDGGWPEWMIYNHMQECRVGRALIIFLLYSISVFCLKIFLKCQKYEGVMPLSFIQEISCQIWVKQHFFMHLWHKITKTGLNKPQKQMVWSPLEKWLYIGTETLLVRDQL